MVPWHVYANPHEPHFCVNISLARDVFIYPRLLVEDSPLFEGMNQYARYSNIFIKLVKDNTDDLKTIGAGDGDIGMYSFRKGVATMVSSGCTVSPPIGSI